MTSYVYLMRDREHNAFKIGVSINPFMRSKHLPQEFDLAMSLQVPVIGWKAKKVESILHGLFRESAVTLPYSDGYTEWFDLGVWDDVLAFLRGQRRRLGIGEPEKIAVPVMQVSGQAARRIAREAREAEIRTRIIEENQAQLNRLQEWLADATAQAQVSILGMLDGVPAEGRIWKFNPRLYLAGEHDALSQWCRSARTFSFSMPRGSGFTLATTARVVDEWAYIEIFPPLVTMFDEVEPMPMETEPLLAPMTAVRKLLAHHLPKLTGADRAKLLELHELFEANFRA